MTKPILPELHQLLFEDLLRHALLEDLGRAGDVTSDAVVEHDLKARARIIAREPCRMSGGPVAAMVWQSIPSRTPVAASSVSKLSRSVFSLFTRTV